MTVKQSADKSTRPIWRRGFDFTLGVWRRFRDEHKRSARNVTKHNTRRAYEKLYAADDLLAEYLVPGRLAFYDEVASIAGRYAGRSILDVGCGSGNLLRAVLDRIAEGPGDQVERILALDRARSAVRRTAELVPEAEARLFDLMRDDLGEEKFDLVLCTEVLEHLKRPEKALAVLRGACAVGGTIVATVPNGAIDDWRGHVNFWDETGFSTLLEPIGQTTVRRIDDDRVLLAIVKAA